MFESSPQTHVHHYMESTINVFDIRRIVEKVDGARTTARHLRTRIE